MRTEKPITTFKVQKGNFTLGHEYWSETIVHVLLKRLNRAIRNVERQTVKYFINLNMIQQMQYVYLFATFHTCRILVRSLLNTSNV